MITREMMPILRKRANEFPVLTIIGPRQSGKTTIVKKCFPNHAYVNLEDPETREIAENELFFFRTNDGLEVDLLLQTDDGLQPIEIKSASTWSSSLSDGLHKYLSLIPDAVRPTVVYGGKSIPAAKSGVTARNFLDFA